MVPINDTVYVLGGDIIVAANGKPLSSLHELTTLLMGSKPGDRVQFEIIRQNQRMEKMLQLPPMHF